MDKTLIVFSKIVTHLVQLTGYDEFGTPRSKNIDNHKRLAQELNLQSIGTTRETTWTDSSLKCFFSRCRKNYTREQLEDCCPHELIGAKYYEQLSGNLKRPIPEKTIFRNRQNNLHLNDTVQHIAS